MKKILVSLLILLVSTQAIGAGEGVGDAQAVAAEAPVKLILRVVDGQGNPLAGAQVCVRSDSTGEMAYEYTADSTGIAAIETLAQGVYTAKAVDPFDGYSAAESFNLMEDTAIDLIVRKLAEGSKVTVGSGTEVSGNFFTDMWGNNTSDIDVRAMLHGYATVAWTNEATYMLDTSVVAVVGTTLDAAGNKTYTFDVNPGLTYNDGTSITARDYVFSVLLQSAPETAALGAATYGYSQLTGFTAYRNGKSDVFSGVRLIDEDTFSLTIYNGYLPYFYELTYVNVTPYPISVIAPGFTVADDGDGAYIAPEGEAGKTAFSSELLRKTILDPDNGYQSHPMVTAGPYQLVAYDRSTGTVSFKANRAYKGNDEGQRPLIDEVTLTPVKNSEALDKLEAGDLNIVNKISDASVIAKGVSLYGEQKLKISNYLRSGYGFIGFAGEQGPTASASVRKAIAYALDKEAYAKAFAGDNGQQVYSYYGLGQWMATQYVNRMSELVTTYPQDLKAARKLLEKDGWTLNEKGEKYVEGTDSVRCKLLKGSALKAYNAVEAPVVEAVKVGKSTLLPLRLYFAKLKDSQAAQLLDEMLTANLKTLGFDVKVMDVDFAEMLASVNRQASRTYNMFAFATNFTYVFDPYYAFNGDPEYQGSLNQYGVADAELLKRAKNLRETAPGEDQTYTERWLKLMQRYSEVLPTIPLYSNAYYDFAGNTVQGYLPNVLGSWPAALMYTYLGEELVLPAL